MPTRLGKLALITFLFSILFSLTISAHAYIWYVDGTQGISGNGTSWFEAFKTIQEAVPWAVGSDEIWVKRGIYPLSSTINLNMKMIRIYGGFEGYETEPSQRDLRNNTTTIDGQNLHRVFYVYYGAPRIDGFTITRGRTGSYLTTNSDGGAIYFDQCMDLVPVVINCVFKDNLAEKLGGAIVNSYSSPYILNSSFSGNVAWWKGGAIFNTGTSMPFITNCTFTNNHAGGNVGGWDVGHGGAIFSYPGATPTITNSILWGNSSYYPEDMEIAGSNANNVTYSNVNQDGFAGTNGNIRQDPLLSGSGKFRLLPGSPCIDAGNNSAFPYLPLTDYFGNQRIIDGGSGTATVDMGAHEYVPGEVVGAWYVNGANPTPGDGSSWSNAYRTIQEAVDAAANGNDIYVRAGAYGPVSVISKALNFYGGYEGATTVDGGNLASYGFNISNTSVSISGFRITRAIGSGIHGLNSALTVTNTIFTANPGDFGAGIEISNGPGATINNCTFTGNSASWAGGAVRAVGSITGPITITNSTFANNHADREGGAIHSSAASAPLIVANCTFTNNSSAYSGGAIYSASSLMLANSAFSGNSGTQGGGAIYNTGSSAITGCTFSGNSAAAYASGGAIFNQSGTHTISASQFLGNTAGEDGGGIANSSSANLTVLTSIFADNRAINSDPYRGTGGGIKGAQIGTGTVQVINSTFYGNSATYAGGGMFLGELAGTCSQYRVYNSILWGNSASQYKETGTAPGTGIWGCPDVYQYSNIDQNEYSSYAHNIRQNPMFVNISGTDPSGWDFHLQAGSPSIDTGSNTVPGLPAFDIDGEPRIMDGSGDGGAIADMGVDEVTGPQDTTPPAGTIVINGGSTGTTLTVVTLTLSVTDPSGMSQMCISNTTSCTTWETFATSKSWTLTAGEGTKTVYGWFRDFFGNTTAAPITGTIFLDTTPPADGTITATPGILQIQLNWSGFSDAGSGIASYRLLAAYDNFPTSCFGGGGADLLYTGPNTAYLHTLVGNPVYYRLCAVDGAENFSTGVTATATPERDLTPPTGSIVINNNAIYTRSAIVDLTIYATDPSGVTQMCISETSVCDYSSYRGPYQTSLQLYTSSGGGQTTFNVWFTDGFGNVNSTPFSDSIIVDWYPPSDGALTAVPGNGTISLSWSGFSDGVSGLAGYKLVYEPGGNPYCDSSPVIYQGSDTSYVHTGLTNGIWHYYRVCATDIAGNESWGVTAWALLPLSVPTGLHITGFVNLGINISWNPNPNEAVEGYVIQCRPTWAQWWNEYYPGNVNTYTLTGLYRGQTYVFRVLAYDGNYTRTDPSNEVSGVVTQTTIDFDWDGMEDILWRNTATGRTTIWYMNGATWNGEYADLLPTVSDPDWTIVGVADFNGDFRPDILWRNNATGRTTIWYMNGATWNGEYADVLPEVGDPNWSIVGIADFNGDSNPDLLWRDSSTGRTTIWYMNGATWNGGYADVLPTVADPNWSIVGIADFNGDSNPDLLWRDSSTGRTTIWYMTGPTWNGGYADVVPTVSDPDWQIVAIRDFNKDGSPDLLWRNTMTSRTTVWYMDGPTWNGNWEDLLPTVNDPDWAIVGR